MKQYLVYCDYQYDHMAVKGTCIKLDIANELAQLTLDELKNSGFVIDDEYIDCEPDSFSFEGNKDDYIELRLSRKDGEVKLIIEEITCYETASELYMGGAEHE